MAGGCGATQVYKGGEPDWLTQAGDNNNPNDLPYFITDPPIAAGFIFGYPLHARLARAKATRSCGWWASLATRRTFTSMVISWARASPWCT